jgi:ribosome-binding factor A
VGVTRVDCRDDRHDALLFATFVQQDNLIARTVWAATETAHVRVVRQILEQASRRHRAHARNDG